MQLSSGTVIVSKEITCGRLTQVMTWKDIKTASNWVCSIYKKINVFQFFVSWSRGGTKAWEGAVSVTVMATTDIEIFFYSTAVQASRQTIWFNVFLSLTIIRFISMRDTYFRCISSQLTETAVRPNRSCANLVLSFGPDYHRFGHCNWIENDMKCNIWWI